MCRCVLGEEGKHDELLSLQNAEQDGVEELTEKNEEIRIGEAVQIWDGRSRYRYDNCNIYQLISNFGR